MSGQTRQAKWLAVGTAAGVLVMLIVALWQYPAVLAARDNSDEVRRGNEMAACRSEIRTQTLDRAHTQLAIAQTSLDNANSTVVSLLPAGLAAAMLDPDQVQPVLAEAIVATEAVSTAGDDVSRAITELEDASRSFEQAVAESRLDPDRFLERCRAGDS